MEKIKEKEFSIGNIINLLIIRNELLEIKFSSLVLNRNILVISFYDSEKNQITQKKLKFLSNYKNIVFDNILLISNLKGENQQYKLKIFNENISYMKLYIQTFNDINKSENSFSQIFDLNILRVLTKEEITNLSLNKAENDKNLNLIISELETVNKSLNERQKELDKKEKDIKDIEYNINNQKKIIEQKIIKFKEEILLFKDKCYGECVNEINNKIKKLNKKIATVENNINNKYKILKEKLNNNNINKINNNIMSQEKKDKIANLEIKIKFLEDNINKYKEKNIENEGKIKNFIINEEKLNTNIKKLKDELILTNSQIKEKKLKMSNISNNNNISMSNISIIETKEKDNKYSTKNKKIKNKISFELDKYQKELISKYHIYNILFEYKYIPNNFNDKEILSISLLIMHLSTNPIELNNKFDISHIILLEKFIFNLLYLNKINSFIILIKQSLEDLYNKLPEFKNNIYTFISNNNYKNSENEFQPLIDININEINLSSIICNKCYLFWNFLMKNNSTSNNERKNKIKKFTIISNILISLLFCSSKNGMNDILKQIISFLTNYNKNEEIKKYLIKIKLTKILLLIFEKANFKYDCDLIRNLFDCILYSLSLVNLHNNNYEKDFEIFFMENTKLYNYLKNNIQEFNSLFEERRISSNDNYEKVKNIFTKTIILITNISIHCPKIINRIKEDFMESINNIKNIIHNKKEDKIINLINKNISILSKLFILKINLN